MNVPPIYLKTLQALNNEKEEGDPDYFDPEWNEGPGELAIASFETWWAVA